MAGDVISLYITCWFLSILFGDPNSLTLWASRYDVLNDTSEGNIAFDVYQKVCKKIKETHNVQIDLNSIHPSKTVLMNSKVQDKIKNIRTECSRYVCCFSKESDQLSMWRYYTKNNVYEGYNIGLNAEVLNSSFLQRYQADTISMDIYPVIYDIHEQEQLVEKFLCNVLDKYNQTDDISVRYVISNQLTKWALLFKGEQFKHECEVRAIINIKEPSLQKDFPFVAKYRNNGMCIIPYVEVKFDKNCVSSIMCGPQNWSEDQRTQQIKHIDKILKKENYALESNLIHTSAVPIRY